MAQLTAGVLARSPVAVAPDLLGAVVRHGPVAVRLTEVEAYAGEQDPGSHAFRGPTARNAVMFGPPGHAYLYFTYGMHTCLNVVCGSPGHAAAVLLRAGEVVAGADEARRRRQLRRAAPLRDAELARGPACLVQALGVGLADNGVDLTAAGASVQLLTGEPPAADRVRSGPRVGVSGAGGDGTTYPWRFWIEGEPSVSAYRPAVSRSRPGRRQRPR